MSDGIEKLQQQNQNRKGRRLQSAKHLQIGRYFDFSTIESMGIPVALIIASEYDRSKAIVNWTPFAIDVDRWNPEVRNMLQAIGFFELANVDTPAAAVLNAGRTKLLRMRRGNKADGEAIGNFMTELGIDPFAMPGGLYEAITEAIVNCLNHAYRNAALLDRHTLKAWWLTAALTDKGDGTHRLQIVVYDQGASVPRTLPSWERFPLVQKAIKAVLGDGRDGKTEFDPDDARFDGDAIAVAIQVGKTATRQPGRGLGLPQIVQVLELCQGGTVAIYSRSGEFRQSKGGKPESVNRATPITGTMVSWDLIFSRSFDV